MKQFAMDQIPAQREWHALQGERPRYLYHYTTLDGAMGILRSQNLWASDVRFLNDSSELEYAATIIDNVVAQTFGAITDPALATAVSSIGSISYLASLRSRPFIACFCEEPDLLSQWRAYGRGQAPVSLGFEFIGSGPTVGLGAGAYMRRVIYDPGEQERHVRRIVQAWLTSLVDYAKTEGVQVSELLPYPGAWALIEALTEPRLFYKNPAFKEEKEWRIVRLVDPSTEFRRLDDLRDAARVLDLNQWLESQGIMTMTETPPPLPGSTDGVDILFRASPLGIVPYIQWPLVNSAGPFAGRIPLDHIIQGPTAHPELSQESLAMFLASLGYGPPRTKVLRSAVPLRAS